jgi:hypothetical protein
VATRRLSQRSPPDRHASLSPGRGVTHFSTTCAIWRGKNSEGGVQPSTPHSLRNSSNSMVNRCRSGLSRRRFSISDSALSNASGGTSRLEKILRKLRSTSASVIKLSLSVKTGRHGDHRTIGPPLAPPAILRGVFSRALGRPSFYSRRGALQDEVSGRWVTSQPSESPWRPRDPGHLAAPGAGRWPSSSWFSQA